MKHGAEWYKRDPAAYLGGVQGMSAREHAVYSVVLDLIYAHGGAINNDPRWIAGWIADMGAAAVRATISDLATRGKLIVTETEIRQKRAENEVKTRENLRETRQKAGKKGGENSAKSRAASQENNDLGQASASIDVEPIREEKRREERVADADSSVREVENRDEGARPPEPDWLTFRERILTAIGVDPVSGLTGHGGQQLGTMADMEGVARWRQMGLTEPEILGVVAEVMVKRSTPPASLRYFTPAMTELRDAKAAAPPPEQGPGLPVVAQMPRPQSTRQSEAERRHQAVIRAAVMGAINGQ